LDLYILLIDSKPEPYSTMLDSQKHIGSNSNGYPVFDSCESSGIEKSLETTGLEANSQLRLRKTLSGKDIYENSNGSAGKNPSKSQFNHVPTEAYLHTKRTLLFIFILFIGSVILLTYVYARFPELEK